MYQNMTMSDDEKRFSPSEIPVYRHEEKMSRYVVLILCQRYASQAQATVLFPAVKNDEFILG
jgi:hypothetical protein